jgi:hypothetical protein
MDIKDHRLLCKLLEQVREGRKNKFQVIKKIIIFIAIRIIINS